LKKDRTETHLKNRVATNLTYIPEFSPVAGTERR